MSTNWLEWSILSCNPVFNKLNSLWCWGRNGSDLFGFGWLLGSYLVLFIAVKKPVFVVPCKNTAIVKPSFPATSRVVLLSTATYATNPSQLQEITSLSNLFLFWPSLPLLLDWLGIGLRCLASNHLTDLRTNTLITITPSNFQFDGADWQYPLPYKEHQHPSQ